MPNVDEMWQGARDAVTVKRVFGKPVESDGVTVIPAAAVRGGAGGGDHGNGGGGFGVAARPIGAYVIRGGKVRWRPAIDLNRLLLLAGALAYLIARRAQKT